MLQYLYSILTIGIFRKIWLKLLILLSIMLLLLFLYKKTGNSYRNEGFTQNQNFMLKYNDKIYDDFYAEVYDKINKPHTRTPYEINTIIKMTQVDNKSNFLDVGSGTGYVVNELTELGYSAYGVDKSSAMVDYSSNKYPETLIKCGDVKDPMLYDKNVFSHVLCLYYTIYQFKNKIEFFKNSYFWIKPGGYLILHLVDRKKFDVNVPASKHVLFGSPQSFKDTRCTDSLVDFDGFKYKCSYKFHDSKETTVTETFTDSLTGNVRQNEQTLYMEDIEDIISMTSYVGFIPHGKVDLKESSKDENQFLYVFERPM